MKGVYRAFLCAGLAGLSACATRETDDAAAAQEAALATSPDGLLALELRDSGKELTVERGSRLRVSLNSPVSSTHRWTVFQAPNTLTLPLAKYDRDVRMKTFRWTVMDDAPLDAVDNLIITPERKVDSGWEIDWSNFFVARLRYVPATAARPADV